MSTPTTAENLEERQSATDEPWELASALQADVDNALGRSTPASFDRDLDSAIENAQKLLDELKAIRS